MKIFPPALMLLSLSLTGCAFIKSEERPAQAHQMARPAGMPPFSSQPAYVPQPSPQPYSHHYADPYAKPHKVYPSGPTSRPSDSRYIHPAMAEQLGNFFYTDVPVAYRPDFRPVPASSLSNGKNLRRKQTPEQFQQAYDIAVSVVAPLAGLPREQQLIGIAKALRGLFDQGGMYSHDLPYYNTPYGYLVRRIASCAGSTRATGLCLSILGIPYEHVNPYKWAHQWCRVRLPDGSFWIVDPFGLYVGAEHLPYRHPGFPED